MKPASQALAASIVQMPARRISLFNRFCTQTAAELGDRLIRRRLAVDPEYPVLVGIECNRSAMHLEVGLRRGKIREGRLARHEPQQHEPAGRIIHKGQQGAGRSAILEPSMFQAVDLHQRDCHEAGGRAAATICGSRPFVGSKHCPKPGPKAPLYAALRTRSSRSAPRRDQRTCCHLAMRRLTRKFAVPSISAVPTSSPARCRSPSSTSRSLCPTK
jgi:hypothetical protein